MNVQYKFINVPEEDKEEIEGYAAEKIADLAKYMRGIPDGSIHVRVGIESMEKHTALRANIKVDIEHGRLETFVAEEVKHTYTEALDMVKDMLARQLQRSMDRRSDHSTASAEKYATLLEDEEEVLTA